MWEDRNAFCTAYNFGPDPEDTKSVEDLTRIFIRSFGKGSFQNMQIENAPHEARLLLLDSTKAQNELGWSPLLDAQKAIEWTAAWYADRNRSASDKCQDQIGTYLNM
jgi:CDP-glucose 4,6-dehydratase